MGLAMHNPVKTGILAPGSEIAGLQQKESFAVRGAMLAVSPAGAANGQRLSTNSPSFNALNVDCAHSLVTVRTSSCLQKMCLCGQTHRGTRCTASEHRLTNDLWF